MESEKKILLIEPPFFRLLHEDYSKKWVPLALLYLAAGIEKWTSWDIRILNADFNLGVFKKRYEFLMDEGYSNYKMNLEASAGRIWDEIIAQIKEYKPQIIGISVKSQNLGSATKLAKLIKEYDDSICVIAGGAHVTVAAEEVMAAGQWDYCFKAEAEESIATFINKFEKAGDVTEVPGLCYLKDGKLICNPSDPLGSKLDELDFPHRIAERYLINYKDFPARSFQHLMSSRGCPYSCTFCCSPVIWNKKVYYRNLDVVLKEVEALYNKGYRKIHFLDDWFGSDKKRTKELCERMTGRFPGLIWRCEMHVKGVSDEVLEYMYAAGCRIIGLGVESGNDRMLDRMNKRISIDQALRAYKLIHRKGFRLTAYFLAGMPGETKESLQDTFRAIKKMRSAVIHFSQYIPLPGSEAYKECQEEGLLGEDFSTYMNSMFFSQKLYSKDISSQDFDFLLKKMKRFVDRRNNRIRSWRGVKYKYFYKLLKIRP